MTVRRIARAIILALALNLTLAMALLSWGRGWLLTHYEQPAIDPAWALSASTEVLIRTVTVQYSGILTPPRFDQVALFQEPEQSPQ